MKNLFAERLSILLEEKRMSKRALARETGLSAMSISDWSTGKIQPTAESIYIIANYFSVSSDFLLGLEDESGRKTYNITNTINDNHGTINQSFK